MPCSDWRDNLQYINCTEEEKAAIRKDCRHNSDVAELLCGVMRQLKISGMQHLVLRNNPGLDKWWREHQERDAARAEAARQKRLSENNAKKIRIAKLEAELAQLKRI